MNKILVLIYFLSSLAVEAQNINWVSFDDLQKLNNEDPKPVMVFIHTDWCKYCLMQEEVTFKDSLIVTDLNENYYCVKLDSESDEPISFLNRTYHKKGNYHTLSYVLGAQNNQLSYPTTVVLSPQFQITKRWVGYLSKEQLEVVN